MKLHDVTLPLSADLPVWPGDPTFALDGVSALAAGDPASVSALRLGTHAGTHVDAPSHLLAGGRAVDQLSLDLLVGPAWVCHLPSAVRSIDSQLLGRSDIPEGTRRLLLRTGNSELWARSPSHFVTDYASLTPDAAQWIADRGIGLLGIDYLSVDPADAEELPAHRILLSRQVVIVEGLDLRDLPHGAYWLLCLPLRLVAADGSPARVVLMEGEP